MHLFFRNNQKKNTTESSENPCLDTIIVSQLKVGPQRREQNIGERTWITELVLGFNPSAVMY